MFLKWYSVFAIVFAAPHPKTFQSLESTSFGSGWNDGLHYAQSNLGKSVESMINIFTDTKDSQTLNMPRVVSDFSLKSLVSEASSASWHSELNFSPLVKKIVWQHISELKYDPLDQVLVGREIWNKRDDGALIKYTTDHVYFHENYMNIWAGESVLKNSNPSGDYPVIITVFKKDDSIDDQSRQMYKDLKDHYKIWYGMRQAADLGKVETNYKSLDNRKVRKFHLPKDYLIYSNDEDMVLIGPKSLYLNFHTNK